MSYDVGDISTLRYTLRDETGALADADVTATVLHADGSETTPVVARVSTGVYQATVAIDAAGTWRYRFAATGAIEEAQSGVFVVPVIWSEPVAWSPSLRDVAAYVPLRTTSTSEAGQQSPLGTFTVDTVPDDQTAAALIAMSTAHVAARLGIVADSLFGDARAVAAIRAAGFIELAHPATDDDVNTAKALLDEAKQMLTDLLAANSAAGGGSAGDSSHLLPAYSFPEACPNLDRYPIF